MGDHDPAMVDGVAAILSGAPSPSTRSYTKARRILDYLEERAAAEDEAYAARMLAETTTTGLRIDDGHAVVDARPPHELVVAMASAMAETLGDARNYREDEFIPASMVTDVSPAEGPWFVLTVQRKDGKTPAQLKAEAEAETERLRGLLRGVAVAVRGDADGVAYVDRDHERLPEEIAALAHGAVVAAEVEPLRAEAERLQDAVKAARGVLAAVLPIVGYVARGREYVQAEPYPDAAARRALGLADDAGLLDAEGNLRG